MSAAAVDVVALTADYVDIASPSFEETAFADRIEADLSGLSGVAVTRTGDDVIARTDAGRDHRVVLCGHLDTVPAAGNLPARIDDDRTVWGLGAADMKGGLACFVALARSVPVEEMAVDVTWVAYVAEEVAARHNGLVRLTEDPELARLVTGDIVVLGEPTGGQIEAGCQGTMRLEVTVEGRAAHTARPWMGANAVVLAADVVRLIDTVADRRPVVDGCEFRESLVPVRIEGGRAANVVPDLVTLTLNYRFAPDRDATEAEAVIRELVDGVPGVASVVVTDVAAGARPGLAHPLLAGLVERNRMEIRAKLGWTDVARFAGLGIPGVNLGPGDSELAHRPDERVTEAQLDRVYDVLRDLVTTA